MVFLIDNWILVDSLGLEDAVSHSTSNDQVVILLFKVHSAIVVRAHRYAIDLFVFKIDIFSQSLAVLQIWDGSNWFLNALIVKSSYTSRREKRCEKEVVPGRD